jgi:hypothetical protein
MRAAMSAVLTLGLAFVLWGSGPATPQAPPPKPPPPPATVPPIDPRTTTAVCVLCDEPFDFDGHKTVMMGLLSNPHVEQLRRAMYFQDIVHQFESKAHFDNCDFDGAIAYLAELWAETDGHVTAAKQAGDAKTREAAVGKAFFTLGQGLHAVQDFYAHSNYVDVQVKTATRATNIRVVRPWQSSDRSRIDALRGQGLVSGFVFWGFPQRCPGTTPSHADLAKDSPQTKSGRIVVASLENLTHYQIAVFLAREASKDYLEDAFRRWPLLREVNGAHVGFDMFVDRRGL